MPTDTATTEAVPIEPPPIADGRPSWFPRRAGAPTRRWLAGVIVVAALAEVAARIVVGTTSPEIRWYDAATQLRVEMMDERGATDVVFAGTSSAWQAFVPEAFTSATGRRSFNAGLAGAVPVVTGPWLTDEVAPRLDPGLVVWGLTALDLATGYGDDQLAAYDTAVATDDRLLMRVDRAVASVSELVRSRRLLRSVGTVRGDEADERAERWEEAVAVTGPDGERLDFGPPDPDDTAIQRARLADFAIDPDDLRAIRRANATLQDRGVRVVFVELPVPTRFRDLLAPDDTADVSAAVRGLGAQLGVDVIDLRDTFADASFVDDTHLDRTATIAATELVAAALERLDDVTSGRCEPLGLTDPFGFEWAVDVCRNA